ncbi:T-complex protein 1 subunit theta [Trichinella sp. T8]|nr:T-complex protein 1 subunit theta [Trichinella sp. T8]
MPFKHLLGIRKADVNSNGMAERQSACTTLGRSVGSHKSSNYISVQKMAPGSMPRVGFARLLKDGVKHYRGVEESLFRNIEACLGIAATVRSSFGPKGMNKMVVNHLGKLYVTNDAAVILRELEVEHPAAKLLVMACEMMDFQIGDGTNFVIILSASLLDSAKELIRMGLNVSQIISGYNMALAKALELLPKFVCKSVHSVRDDEAVKAVVRSSIATKVYGQEDMLSDLVVQACTLALGADYSTYHVDNIRICKILGSNVEASTVMNGMAFQDCVSGEIKLIENPKVAVFSCAFAVTKLENPSSIVINTAKELMQFSKHDEEYIENYIKSLHNAGVNVVVSGGKFGDLHLHYLNKYKMMAVKISSKFDLRRLCRCTHSTIIPDMSRVPTPDMIGSCTKVQVREIGSDQLVFFEQNLKGGSLSTIIIRGSSQNTLTEVEKAIDDGVNDGRLLPGAGAAELAIAREIRQFGLTYPSLERYAIEKFAIALESLPKQIADNIGAKWVEIYPHLMKKHENGENNYGLDIKAPKGGILNAVSAEIFDCFSVKEWAIKLAVNAVNTIINVDQIVLAKPAGGPPIRQPKSQEDDDTNFSQWKRIFLIDVVRGSSRTRSTILADIEAKAAPNKKWIKTDWFIFHWKIELQLRAQKVEKVKRNKNQYGSARSPPIAVVILSLSPKIDSNSVIGNILACRPDATVTSCDRNIYFLSSPNLKRRFCFLIPDHWNMIEVLDAFKVADVAVLLWDCDTVTLHNHFSSLLSAVSAQGMPYHFNISLNAKMSFNHDKKRLASVVERWGLRPKFCRNYDLLLKLIANCAKQPLSLQQHHSRIIVESCSIVEQNDDLSVCTLKINGYVRGPPLDVNHLLHIPGWGDFQMDKIDVITDPHPLHKYGKSHVIETCTFAVADPAKQENLESQATVDEMNVDQTWPTEEEIAQSQKDTEHLIRRLPEGTSTYQACWILDNGSDDDVSEPEQENECNTALLNLDEDMDSLIAVSRAESVDQDGEEVEMSEDVDTECSDENDDVDQVERCRREKEERENEKFPDEVDTPLDVSAAERFQKYRGLASFRTSHWDVNEELPPEYGRIFQFENFKATCKRIVNEEKTGAPAGWYTSVYVLNVPLKLAEESIKSNKQPLVAYELLPHEQKMSVVNVTIRKNHLFNGTVKSKDRLLFQIGYRRFFAAPIFSQHTIGNKHKFQRFLPADEVTVASMYAPIIFGPAGVVVFKVEKNGTHGRMKCVFSGQLTSQDVVFMDLYKRVFPKWTYEPDVTMHLRKFRGDKEHDELLEVIEPDSEFTQKKTKSAVTSNDKRNSFADENRRQCDI